MIAFLEDVWKAKRTYDKEQKELNEMSIGERIAKPFKELFGYGGSLIRYNVTGAVSEKEKKEKKEIADKLNENMKNKGESDWTPLQVYSLIFASFLFVVYVARGRR